MRIRVAVALYEGDPPALAVRWPACQRPAMQVTLIAVQSLDGCITRHGMPGAGFASGADQAHFRAALRQFDCSVMGRATYETLHQNGTLPPAPGRRRIVLTRSPERFIAGDRRGLDGPEFSAAAPAEIVARLRADGHRACAVLGGGQIHSLFLEAGLVDELWLTIEPRLFGGGTRLIAGPADVRLRLQSHELLGEDVLLLKYAVVR